jgi:hypothetical protein
VNRKASPYATGFSGRALAVVLVVGLGGCASPGNAQATSAQLSAASGSGFIPPFSGPARQAAATCRGPNGFADSELHARTFLWRPEWLIAIKAGRNSQPFGSTFKALIAEADAAFQEGPFSVVAKTHVPPSGDKHDYYSVAPYSWPNPDTPNGLPYIDRDGQVNPERYDQAFDTGGLEKMSRAVASLALAYHLTDERRYAQRAGQLLRVWFLAPGTKMNPNLRFAQAVPGRVDGRPAGLIDSYRLVRVVEAIGLIGKSGVLSNKEQSSLEAWFGDYAAWLKSDPLGVSEGKSTNNHGIYYDAQLMSFSLFARREDLARAVAEGFTPNRIAVQVAPDGSLPHELRRTRSFHYTNYALAGAFDVAAFAECLGFDLWNARTPNGRSLRSAFDFVAKYAGDESDWPYPELRLDTEPFHDLLVRASWAWRSADYAAAASRYAGKHEGSLSAYLRVAPISDAQK